MYVLTTLGSFGVVLLAARSDGEAEELEDYKGLGARDPMLALLMLMLMFSTAGVPPFVGFWAKLWIIQALLHTQHVWLATLAVLASVVGAYYYLRVIWYMYFQVYNKYGEPVVFLPKFDLVTKDLNTLHLDEPHPIIVEFIRKIEDPESVLKPPIQTTIDISRRPIPASDCTEVRSLTRRARLPRIGSCDSIEGAHG